MKSNPFAGIFLWGVLIFLAVGFVRLFQVRFEEGDIYPPYSSLRGDPLGVRMLSESLDSLNGIEVDQNTKPIHQADFPENATLIRLGVDSKRGWLPNAEFDAIQMFLVSGGRLVMAMRPVAPLEPDTENEEGVVCENCGKIHNPSKTNNAETDEQETTGVEDTEDDSDEEKINRGKWNTNLYERWGVEMVSVRKAEVTPQDRLAEQTSPWDLPYDSWLTFQPTNNAWRVLHRFGSEPVVIQRSYGAGSIVLVGSSYPFSNEAMLNPTHLSSIMAFLGDSNTVIFDESHLGVRRQTSLMDLVYTYDLEGVLATLGFIAFLYLWRSLVPLIPPYTEARIDQDYGHGRFDAVSGLTQLMRRHLPLDQTPATLLTLYRQANRTPLHPKQDRHTDSRMQALIEEPERTSRKNILSTIQKLHRMANEKPGG